MAIKHLWLAVASLPITAGIASGDTLDLVRTAVANGVTVNADDSEEDTLGLFFRFNFGANFMDNANIKDIPMRGPGPIAMPAGTNGRPGLSNAAIKFNTGIDATVAFGYELSDWLSIELQTGLVWNGVNGVTGNWMIPNGQPGGVQQTVTTNIWGGNGNLYQVPMMVNLNFDIPLSTPDSERWPFIGCTTYLTLNLGVGAEYAKLKIDDIQLPGGAGVPTLNAGIDKGAWGFAYQVGANLRMEIAHNMDLGLYFQFRGTSSMNFGSPSVTGTPLVSGMDFTVSSLMNYAVGMNFRIEF